MGLRDLHKLLDKEQSATEKEESPAMRALINKCRNVPFYCWGQSSHHTVPTNCSKCFNCIIGLPRKGNREYPLFEYEHLFYRALTEPAFINTRKATDEENKMFEQMKVNAELQSQNKHGSISTAEAKYLKEREETLVYPHKVKHLACLKASSLGISEISLRFLAWICLSSDKLKGSQIVIFTGPRLELAVSLISRLKSMLSKNHDISFTEKETVCNLNGTRIEAFPSHHADSARGLPNISAILVDEFSFIPDRETDNIFDIMLRNVPKSNPYLIAVSTPRQQGDAMYKLLGEKYEDSAFKWLKLDWTYGLGKIFTQEEIDKIKNQRSFEREYNLKFSGLEGNLLSETAIQRCISTGEKLAETAPLDDWTIPTQYVMSIDIGWGSDSATAIMVSRFVNGKVQILYAKEFFRALFQDMIDEVWRLKNKCHGNLKVILMDASATELYTTLCNEFGQNASQKYLRDKQTWCKQTNSNIMQYLFVCPIPFNPMTKTMTQHTQRLIQETDYDGTALVGIHKQFEDLILSCNSAYAIEIKLDKERTVHADTFDALRMNLQYYNFGDK